MEDFSSEFFSTFFDDHLAERPQIQDGASVLLMETEGSPGKLLLLLLLRLASLEPSQTFLSKEKRGSVSSCAPAPSALPVGGGALLPSWPQGASRDTPRDTGDGVNLLSV